MPIEIEKKYRLTNKQKDSVRHRLPEIGATLQGEEFEENTLYGGMGLEVGRSVLRLRRDEIACRLGSRNRAGMNRRTIRTNYQRQC